MVLPRPLFYFLNGRFLITFSAFFLIRLASLAWKTPQNFARAPRALFSTQIWSKTPFWGFWSDDTRIKKLFLLFFPPLLLCPARAARRNFRFFPGIFLLKRSQDEVRSTWNFRNLSTVTFSRGPALYTRKNTGCNPPQAARSGQYPRRSINNLRK